MPTDSEPAYLYLTTVGRRSRRPREIEIWFTRQDGRYYLIAEYTSSHWVQNLLVTPQVEVRVGEERFRASARVITPESEPRLHSAVQQLSRGKYGWGEGLVVELTPEPGTASGANDGSVGG